MGREGACCGVRVLAAVFYKDGVWVLAAVFYNDSVRRPTGTYGGLLSPTPGKAGAHGDLKAGAHCDWPRLAVPVRGRRPLVFPVPFVPSPVHGIKFIQVQF